MLETQLLKRNTEYQKIAVSRCWQWPNLFKLKLQKQNSWASKIRYRLMVAGREKRSPSNGSYTRGKARPPGDTHSALFVHLRLLYNIVQHYSFTLATFVQYREQPKGAVIYVQLYSNHVQCTMKSSHSGWKQSAECPSQDVTLHMGSNLLWRQYHLQYFGRMLKLKIWDFGKFYATRCSSITVAFL